MAATLEKKCLTCFHCVEDTSEDVATRMARMQQGQLGPAHLCLDSPPSVAISVTPSGQLMQAQGYPSVSAETVSCHHYVARVSLGAVLS